MTLALSLSLFILAVWLIGGVELVIGSRRIDYLRDVAISSGDPPRASIIVAARNEEAKVRDAVESLLAQRGLDLRVVVVDDRSDDATGSILDEIARRWPHLGVVHLSELPDGWLGKTHALHVGARAAYGEWILFTDADVVLAPDAVRRAIDYADAHRLDHLAVTPELTMPGPATDLFGGIFVLLFSRFATPWKARDPRSRAHIGIGAFNLLRSSCYGQLGGHERLRLRPDDDLMLGKLVKRSGFRQDVAYGTGQVKVEWYGSIGEAVRGLEKNAFAGLGYSVVAVLAACGAIVLFGVWPWIALVAAGGGPWLLSAASVGTMVALYVDSTRTSGANPWLAPAIPLAICVVCFTVLRSAALALARGRIDWRGTSYRLEELRAFDV